MISVRGEHRFALLHDNAAQIAYSIFRLILSLRRPCLRKEGACAAADKRRELEYPEQSCFHWSLPRTEYVLLQRFFICSCREMVGCLSGVVARDLANRRADIGDVPFAHPLVHDDAHTSFQDRL